MNEMPKPIYVVHREGGALVPFDGLRAHLETQIDDGSVCTKEQWTDNYRVHAIYFADGSQFDAVNGWRKPSSWTKPIVRVKMGRKEIENA